jgi:mannose-6-phosphate isomerase-like protein (cupin superfamily)
MNTNPDVPQPALQSIQRLPEAFDYLAPDTAEVRLLCGMRGGGVAHALVPPGRATLAVVHGRIEEIWYFLSGPGEVWRKLADLEETVDVGPGTCVPIAPGVHFQIRNLGSEPLCFLMCTMPPWPGPQEARRVPDHWPVDMGTYAPERFEEDTLMDPVQVVQDFVDAANAQDVDRVVGCFGADAVMQDDPGTVFARGREAIRAHFGGFLGQSPTFHAEVRSRIQVGSWVVQEEHVTGLVLEEPVPEFSIPCAYRVEDGKIVKCIGFQEDHAGSS